VLPIARPRWRVMSVSHHRASLVDAEHIRSGQVHGPLLRPPGGSEGHNRSFWTKHDVQNVRGRVHHHHEGGGRSCSPHLMRVVAGPPAIRQSFWLCCSRLWPSKESNRNDDRRGPRGTMSWLQAGWLRGGKLKSYSLMPALR
jgi:hypothetical protein